MPLNIVNSFCAGEKPGTSIVKTYIYKSQRLFKKKYFLCSVIKENIAYKTSLDQLPVVVLFNETFTSSCNIELWRRLKNVRENLRFTKQSTYLYFTILSQFYNICLQCAVVRPIIPVRAVPALLQLLLPADRASTADPGRVAHRPLDHAHASHPHTQCQRH